MAVMGLPGTTERNAFGKMVTFSVGFDAGRGEVSSRVPKDGEYQVIHLVRKAEMEFVLTYLSSVQGGSGRSTSMERSMTMA